MTSKPPYLYIFHVKNIKGRKNSGQKEVKSFLWIPISESESRALNFRRNYHQATILMILIFSYIPINTYTTCWFFFVVSLPMYAEATWFLFCESFYLLKKLKFGKWNLWKQGIAQTELPLLHLKQFCFFMQNCPRYENACLM